MYLIRCDLMVFLNFEFGSLKSINREFCNGYLQWWWGPLGISKTKTTSVNSLNNYCKYFEKKLRNAEIKVNVIIKSVLHARQFSGFELNGFLLEFRNSRSDFGPFRSVPITRPYYESAQLTPLFIFSIYSYIF